MTSPEVFSFRLEKGCEEEAEGDGEVSWGEDAAWEGDPVAEGEGGGEVVEAVSLLGEVVAVAFQSCPVEGIRVYGHSPVEEDREGVEESSGEDEVDPWKVAVCPRRYPHEEVSKALGEGGGKVEESPQDFGSGG